MFFPSALENLDSRKFDISFSGEEGIELGCAYVGKRNWRELATHTHIHSIDTFLKVCVLKNIFSPLESIFEFETSPAYHRSSGHFSIVDWTKFWKPPLWSPSESNMSGAVVAPPRWILAAFSVTATLLVLDLVVRFPANYQVFKVVDFQQTKQTKHKCLPTYRFPSPM